MPASIRDGFLLGVKVYGRCVSEFITARQQPGTPAGPEADQAACAHSWAENKATEATRSFGQACIAYANRSVMDIRLPVYEGSVLSGGGRYGGLNLPGWSYCESRLNSPSLGEARDKGGWTACPATTRKAKERL